MKLRDVITTVAKNGYLSWINFDFDWKIDNNGCLCPVEKVKVTLDSNVNIVYQWFWHCNKELNTKEIWNAISNHDYETFMKWYDIYKYENITYFPAKAYIFIGEECIGSVCVVYAKEVFNLITNQDYECG